MLTSELLIRQSLLVALQVFQQALQGFRVRSRHAVEEERAVKNFQDLWGVGRHSIIAGRLSFTGEREKEESSELQEQVEKIRGSFFFYIFSKSKQQK